jgi:peptide-methionine (S)-S-oxide reductase
MTIEIATLGGGCFWCLEAAFQNLKGVETVVPGYAGGTTPNPSYEQVCSGSTGHAEVAQIRFDADVINYRTLLEVFFIVHDPTTLNQQGADIGTQYRSVILYHSHNQQIEAEKLVAELDDADRWSAPIVTEIKPLESFYEAEKYHHNYYQQRPTQPYCQAVISPKLAKLRKEHSSLLAT